MANEVMQSLFGITPTAVQQQIQREQEARAMSFANRSATPMASYYAGRAIESARGTPLFPSQQDPRLSKAQSLQSIIGNVKQYADLATPEGLVQLAEALNADPEFTGMSVALRQEAARMQAEARKAQFAEAKIASETAENLAQADKARMPPKPEKVDRQDRWIQLDAKKNSPEGLTTPEKNEYNALSRLLFKPEKGSDETATATRWNLETVAAQQSLTAMGVDWTKPLTGRNAALPGIVEVYQKANRGPWPGTGAAAKPAPATPTPAPARQMSAQDQEALRWANANPNDPRATAIKNRLGVK